VKIVQAGNVECMVYIRIAYKILVGKPQGKKQRKRPRCRLQDNIKTMRMSIGFIWLRIKTNSRLL